MYPQMFVAPDGRVVSTGPDPTTRIFDPGSGSWSVLGDSGFTGHAAVMYRPGKILKAGTYDNVIRLLPPLTIDEPLLEEGLGILDEAIGTALAG